MARGATSRCRPEVFPSHLVGTVTGLGGAFGGAIGVVTQLEIGRVVQNVSYTPLFVVCAFVSRHLHPGLVAGRRAGRSRFRTAPRVMRVEFPGLVDIQVNGFAGVDFNSRGLTAAQITTALDALRATGVTRCLPTLITGVARALRRPACARSCRFRIPRSPDPPRRSVHLAVDGPEAHTPLEHTAAASIDDFRRRQDAADGRIVLVTLAPEVEGALALIEYLASSRCPCGHRPQRGGDAIVRDAIAAGATLSTHLGNGCAAVLPRHPNMIGSSWPPTSSSRASSWMAITCRPRP